MNILIPAVLIGVTALLLAGKSSAKSKTPSTYVPPVSPTGVRPILREGSRGEAVKEWQNLLGTVKPDGIFGPITRAYTEAYQKNHPPLVVDGVVGPKTWAMALSGA